MTTTIALREETALLLRQLKTETKSPSFDALITRLVQEAKTKPASIFGKFRDVPEFHRDEFDRLDQHQ